MRKSTSQPRKFILDLLEIVFISTSITALTFFFLAQPLEVTGESMLPNFYDKDQLIVEKVSIKYEELKRGEVVIVKHPDNPQVFLIKRVIGLPGEIFLIQNDSVLINGEIIKEDYLAKNTFTKGGNYIGNDDEVILDNKSYILLGDNRENSADSRTWGPLTMENMVGRSLVVYYPLKNIKLAQ